MSHNTESLTGRDSTPPISRDLAFQSRHSDLLGVIIACLIPMMSFLDLNLVGNLYISEVLLLCLLPFLLYQRWRLLFHPFPRTLLLLGGAWLLAQVFTDVVRETPFADWSRGWSKISFLLLNFSAVYLYLNGKTKRFIAFAAGIALGQILSYFINPGAFAASHPWKFGYGNAVTVLTVLASQSRVLAGRKILSGAVLVGMGMLNLYLGFRSLAVVCLLAGWFIWVNPSRHSGFTRRKWRQIALLSLLGGIALYGIAALYGYGADEGWFGAKEREKYRVQSQGELGVLLGGRAQIFASVQAVFDSPIIGHGSWAKDRKYVNMMRDELLRRGYRDIGEVEKDLIPSHSYIMGAWVEAGVVGALFWFWALILTVRAMIAIFGARVKITPLIAFIAFTLMWHIPFSPFGGLVRLYAAYNLSLMMLALTLTGSSMERKGRA